MKRHHRPGGCPYGGTFETPPPATFPDADGAAATLVRPNGPRDSHWNSETAVKDSKAAVAITANELKGSVRFGVRQRV